MKGLKLIRLGLVVIIFVSFFLPWVSVESETMGKVSKLLTGKAQANISAVSGFQVPILANSQDSRFMISIIKIFKPQINNADKKSFLIWIVPLLAIALFFISIGFKNKKLVKLLIGLICVAIFAGAIYKINITDLDKLVLNVKIAYGLWITLLSYLAFGLIELAGATKLFFKNKG
ncbi:MAG: hypothetical protein K9L80_01475 [Candidatus Omnitrophica bacterium]|nr:hypothetical protein [Candidatus Omnitrophota bacterium]MCF7888123.1 hypothetical protein [Candidatus Omnitrophota bacterium]